MTLTMFLQRKANLKIYKLAMKSMWDINEHNDDYDYTETPRKFFRVRVVVCQLSLLIGVILGFLGNIIQEMAVLDFACTFLVAGVLVGILTLSKCPVCKKRIPIIGLGLFWYKCPRCGFSAKSKSKMRSASAEEYNSKTAHITCRVKVWSTIILQVMLLSVFLILCNMKQENRPLVVVIAFLIFLEFPTILIKCPGCGDHLIFQTPIWKWPFFKCAHCGFSARDKGQQ